MSHLDGPKAETDEICVCGGALCTCANDFVLEFDPDWTDHYLDVWDAINHYRTYSTAEEWNTAVAKWRAEAGAL